MEIINELFGSEMNELAKHAKVNNHYFWILFLNLNLFFID